MSCCIWFHVLNVMLNIFKIDQCFNYYTFEMPFFSATQTWIWKWIWIYFYVSDILRRTFAYNQCNSLYKLSLYLINPQMDLSCYNNGLGMAEGRWIGNVCLRPFLMKHKHTPIARFLGPTLGPPGTDRTHEPYYLGRLSETRRALTCDRVQPQQC